MPYEEISCKKEDYLAEIIIDRPESYNTFTPTTTKEFKDAVLKHSKDEETRGILITGAGDKFSAGADLKTPLEKSIAVEKNIEQIFREGIGRFHDAIKEIQEMPKPVIAGVNGTAAGAGFSLAIACDLTLISDDATLEYAYTKTGLTGDGGVTFNLPRLVGTKKAMDIALRSPKINSQKAVELGLANEVIPSEKFKSEVRKKSKKLANGPTKAFGWVKKLFREGFDTSLEKRLEEELDTFCKALNTKDFEEGVKAFLEKGEPDFKGR